MPHKNRERIAGYKEADWLPFQIFVEKFTNASLFNNKMRTLPQVRFFLFIALIEIYFPYHNSLAGLQSLNL